MCFQNDSFRRAPDLRIRPVPELGYCMVFTPARPNVYKLNPAAWLLLELCEGQREDELKQAFIEAYASEGASAGQAPEVHSVIEDLERKGILLRQSNHHEELSP